MNIVHVFSSYPNIKQTYNVKLIQRLNENDLVSYVAAFNLNNSNLSNINTLSFRHKWDRWFLYVYYVFSRPKLFYKYKKLTNYNWKLSAYFFGRFAILLKVAPTILHIHHIQLLNEPFMKFIRMIEVKTIVSVRGSDLLLRPYRSNSMWVHTKNCLEFVDGIHAVSKNLADMVELFEIPKTKVYVIYRSPEIDSDTFLKNRVQNLSNKKHIITIGRLHWTKGYIVALKSLFLLKEYFDFEYHIVGSYSEEELDEVLFWVRYLRLEDHVICHGHINHTQLNDLLLSSDIFLQPSLSEGVPNTLLRALALKIPVVTTDAGGVEEVFENYIDGIMVKKGDETALFEAMRTVLNGNWSLKANTEPSLKELNIKIEKEIAAYKRMYDKFI